VTAKIICGSLLLELVAALRIIVVYFRLRRLQVIGQNVGTFLGNLLRINVQLLVWHKSLLHAHDALREILARLTVVGQQ
jgi:hypothetical protein